MNDRYLFRGKIKYSERSGHLNRKNGQWVQGFYEYKIFANGKVPCISGRPVDPATVGQCTGEKDINKILIYGGDIIKIYTDEHYRLAVVEWKRTQWYLRILGTDDDSWCPDEDLGYLNDIFYLEVIGNIHDNPELLEVTS